MDGEYVLGIILNLIILIVSVKDELETERRLSAHRGGLLPCPGLIRLAEPGAHV